MRTYREAALDYVRHVLNSERETPSSLAKRVGISTTTLTRPLNSEDHKFTISMATLEKIKNVTGYDPAPFISKDLNYLERTLDFYNSEEYESVENQSANSADHGVSLHRDDTTILVQGEVEVGAWYYQRFAPGFLDWLIFFTPTKPEDRARCIGLTVKGKGCDKIAREGEVLVCFLRNAESDALKPGEPVIVERHLKGPHLYEISARMPRKRGDGPLALTVHSTDGDLDGEVFEGETDDEAVRVIADVKMVMRAPWDGDIYEEELGRFIRAERMRVREQWLQEERERNSQ